MKRRQVREGGRGEEEETRWRKAEDKGKKRERKGVKDVN